MSIFASYLYYTKHRKGAENMIFDMICLILLIIGGLNWGSIGLFQFDIVAWLFGGADSTLSRIVYTVVALAAIWCISFLFRDRSPMSRE